MTNILQQFEQTSVAKLTENKKIPTFKAGDSLKVHLKVIEGKNERIQMFEGVCIARKNRGINSSFTVRKISFSVGVEKNFPLYSPNIDKIELMKIGKVRRAKLYFMRALTGKKARISEDLKAAAKMRELAAIELVEEEKVKKAAEAKAAKVAEATAAKTAEENAKKEA